MSLIKKFALVFCLMGTIAVAAAAQAPMNDQMASPEATSGGQMKKSLYDRLGGYDAIAAVVDDFITRLAITEDDWNAAAKHLVEALDKYKVPKAEKDELLAFVVTQKKDIVEK